MTACNRIFVSSILRRPLPAPACIWPAFTTRRSRNRQFLVGEEADERVRTATLRTLLEMPEIARVTALRLEIVGPLMIAVIADVDLVGDDAESHVANRLRALEARIAASPAVAGAMLSLSAPDEPSLRP